LARTTYAGFNDHHLCEKLCEVEGFSLGRETLRRLLRSSGIGSPRKRRAPTHRQRRLCRAREGEMLLLDGSLHHWLEDRGPQLTLLGFLDDATRKVPVAEFFPTEDARGYFRLLRRLLRRFGIPLSFYGDRHGIFVRNDDHWSVEEQLAGRQGPTQFGRALDQLGVTYISTGSFRLWLCTACLPIRSITHACASEPIVPLGLRKIERKAQGFRNDERTRSIGISDTVPGFGEPGLLGPTETRVTNRFAAMFSQNEAFASIMGRKRRCLRVLSIRLARIGKKKKPFYRVVVIEKSRPRNGRTLEVVGTYDPLQKPALVKLDAERVKYWLGCGAQPSDTVRSFFKGQKIV
jgi:ribosomal protein S16